MIVATLAKYLILHNNFGTCLIMVIKITGNENVEKGEYCVGYESTFS